MLQFANNIFLHFVFLINKLINFNYRKCQFIRLTIHFHALTYAIVGPKTFKNYCPDTKHTIQRSVTAYQNTKTPYHLQHNTTQHKAQYAHTLG